MSQPQVQPKTDAAVPEVPTRGILTGVTFVGSISSFGGKNSVSTIPGSSNSVDRILPARLDELGHALGITSGQTPGGVLIRKKIHDRLANVVEWRQVFVPWSNVAELIYG